MLSFLLSHLLLKNTCYTSRMECTCGLKVSISMVQVWPLQE